MVMSLQDISRSENGALIPQRTELDLGALIKQIKGQATPLAAHRKIAINTEIHDAPRIHADRDLVRRILENLVDNALKSAPKGSTIRLEAIKGNGVADIRICDQGPGIPSSLREKVFEKYVRLDQAASPHVNNGAGLGLAFCRKAVEAHCGWIWVEDNQPQGSKFCVRLPA
jgi:signal transduction histidine kinase